MTHPIIPTIAIKNSPSLHLMRDTSEPDLAPPRRVSIKYDLPIEYHKKATKERQGYVPEPKQPIRLSKNTAEIRRSRGSDWNNDSSRISQIANKYDEVPRNSRFEYLVPDMLLQRLADQDDHQIVRNLGIDMVAMELTRKLHIIYNIHICDNREDEVAELPNRMFSWSHSDFMARRQLDNTIWIEVMQKEILEKCLEIQKFKCDSEELLKFVDLIFRALQGKDSNFDIKVEVFDYLENTYEFLKIYEKLASEQDRNNQVFRDCLNTSLAMNFNRRDSKQHAQKTNLENVLMNYDVWAPIEIRYQKRFYDTKVAQVNEKLRLQQDTCERDIKKYTDLEKREIYCSQCSVNTLYSTIEKFKVRIAKLTTKYTNESEALDNEIAYTKLSMNKLKQRHLSCLDDLQRWQFEIERMHLRENALKEQEQSEFQTNQAASLKLTSATRKRTRKLHKGRLGK